MNSAQSMVLSCAAACGIVAFCVAACAGDSEGDADDAGPVAPQQCPAQPGDDAVAPSADSAVVTPDATPTGGGALGGKLFILGGAVTDTSPVWDRVLAEGGGIQNVHFLVVTAATQTLSSNFNYYKDVLNRIHGVSLDNIRQLRISDQDDPDSKFVDEREWTDNADNANEISSVRDWATVVWFAGGDQAHIMSTFVRPDGSDRGVTTAIREKLAAGKVIVAGTSAGAAVMSNPMIGEGDPYKSWTYSPLYTQFYLDEGSDGGTFNAENALLLNQGLGFLTPTSHVLIDTHWFQRSRFSRTIRGVDFASGASGLDPKMKVGLGIGENTGILIDVATGIGEVVGDVDASWVGVVNLNEATTSGMTNPFSADKIRVGYLGVRDRFTLPNDGNPNGIVFPEASKTRYLPCNGARRVAPLTGDMFVPGAYVDVLQNLLDGELEAPGAPCHAEALAPRLNAGESTLAGTPFESSGFYFRFTTDSKTKEFWSNSWGWEIENVLMRVGTGTSTYTPPF